MVTKAIILERIVNTNTYSVRVPFLESAGIDAGRMVATVSKSPAMSEEYKVDDVVYVDFEDHRPEKVVIIGKLFVDEDGPRGSANFESLNVSTTAKLPKDTTIGDKSMSVLLNKLENISGDLFEEYSSFAIAKNPITNINDWILTKFNYVNTSVSGYPAIKITTENGNTLTNVEARKYMLDMTGVDFLPVYNYYRPKNTYFLFPDGSVYKVQFDSTNGLLLFKVGVPFLTKTPIISETPTPSVTIDPFKIYNFGTLNQSMTIIFGSSGVLQNHSVEYTFRFVAGSNASISLPIDCLYSGGSAPTLTAGHTYEYNIVDNLVAVGEFYS